MKRITFIVQEYGRLNSDGHPILTNSYRTTREGFTQTIVKMVQAGWRVSVEENTMTGHFFYARCYRPA